MTKIFKMYVDINQYKTQTIELEPSLFYFKKDPFVFNIEVYLNSMLMKATKFQMAGILGQRSDDHYSAFDCTIIVPSSSRGIEYLDSFVPNTLDFGVGGMFKHQSIRPFDLVSRKEHALFDEFEKQLLVDKDEITFRIIYSPTSLNINSMKKWIEKW